MSVGGRHIEKSKNAISRPQFQRFRRNVAQWRSPTLLTVLTVTNLKLFNLLKNPKILISWLRFDQSARNLAR